MANLENERGGKDSACPPCPLGSTVNISSNNTAVADLAAGWGVRNMKFMPPPLAAIFFMIYFTRLGGDPPPPGSATDVVLQTVPLFVTSLEKQWAEKKSGNSFDENKPRRFDGMVPVESLQTLDQ